MLKTFALCLLYAPAMPIVYFITIGGIGVSYWATKFCLLRVCAQPPALDGGISERFRSMLSLALLGSAILQIFVLGSRVPDADSFSAYLDDPSSPPEGRALGAALSLPTSAIFLWVFLAIFPVHLCPCFRRYTDSDSDDTGGKPFSANRGYPKYLCPISQAVPSIAASQDQALEARVVPAAAGGSAAELPPAAQLSSRWTVGPSAPPPQKFAPAPPPAFAPQPPPHVVAQPMPQAYATLIAAPAPVRMPTLLAVVCPDNAGPGAQLTVQGPSGELVLVTVPHGTFAGMVFHVSV